MITGLDGETGPRGTPETEIEASVHLAGISRSELGRVRTVKGHFVVSTAFLYFPITLKIFFFKFELEFYKQITLVFKNL